MAMSGTASELSFHLSSMAARARAIASLINTRLPFAWLTRLARRFPGCTRPCQVAVVLALLFLAAADGRAEQALPTAEIRTLLVGKKVNLANGTMQFSTDGRVETITNAGRTFRGTYTIANNSLCRDYGADGGRKCYRVVRDNQGLAIVDDTNAVLRFAVADTNQGTPGGPAARERTTSPGALGPSFDCSSAATAQQPLALIICANPPLARAELSYVVAYQALRHSLSARDRNELVKEAIATTESIKRECSVPANSAAAQTGSQQTVSCLERAFTRIGGELRSRLSGDAAKEANLPLEQLLAIQKTLRDKGFLPADSQVDGVFGPATRTAITAWQQANSLPATGFASDAALAEATVSEPSQPTTPRAASNAPPAPNASAAAPAQNRPETEFLQGVFVVVALREPDRVVLLTFPTGRACDIDTSKEGGGSTVKALVKLHDRLAMSLSRADYPVLVSEVAQATRKACPSVRICTTYAVFDPSRRSSYENKCVDQRTPAIRIWFSNRSEQRYRGNGYGGLEPEVAMITASVENRAGADVITSLDDSNLAALKQRVAAEEAAARRVQQQRQEAEARAREFTELQARWRAQQPASPPPSNRQQSLADCSEKSGGSLTDEAMTTGRLRLAKGSVLIAGLSGSDHFRQVDQREEAALRRLAQAGGIAIVELRGERSGRGVNLSDMLASSLTGTAGAFDVSPTGIRNEPDFQEDAESFSVPVGRFATQSVAAAELSKHAGDSYCILQFLYRADISPGLRDVVATFLGNGGPIAEQRKGRMLLRWDVFSKKWVSITADYANADRPSFDSNNVPTAYAAIAAGLPPPRSGR